eukprot:18460-Heterococcus_DN1.PRE.2
MVLEGAEQLNDTCTAAVEHQKHQLTRCHRCTSRTVAHSCYYLGTAATDTTLTFQAVAAVVMLQQLGELHCFVSTHFCFLMMVTG